MAILIQLVLALMAIFIILLVLVQRGRGGGLAGALGGPGGSSAFGAKAGDTFTKITIYTVSIWIVACLLASIYFNNLTDPLGAGDASLGNKAEMTSGDEEEPSAGASSDAEPAADSEGPAASEEPSEEPAEDE